MPTTKTCKQDNPSDPLSFITPDLTLVLCDHEARLQRVDEGMWQVLEGALEGQIVTSQILRDALEVNTLQRPCERRHMPLTRLSSTAEVVVDGRRHWRIVQPHPTRGAYVLLYRRGRRDYAEVLPVTYEGWHHLLETGRARRAAGEAPAPGDGATDSQAPKNSPKKPAMTCASPPPQPQSDMTAAIIIVSAVWTAGLLLLALS